ncbi:hypothetical protein CTAM01_05102 [Colletotrichum tamarilloi]|uniref:Uncharacterized protein n=1 Tax=Colletotrichum tamarilloi TaxID=1209934 RepID=A0ABQ9RET4_9PEZI|nr:uncharacterized protein CTAM01_05102 [Colletotrichum tamarilloi]KAK1502289.1 hypothetical protein CTAM01_05102 [Colletotrichum tamarilloi]
MAWHWGFPGSMINSKGCLDFNLFGHVTSFYRSRTPACRQRQFEVIVGQARRLNCAVCLSAVPPSSTAKSDPSPGHLADNSTDHYSHLIIPGAKNGSHVCQLRSKTSQSQLSCSEDYPKAGLLAARHNINREYTFRRMGANPDPSTACRKIICFVSQNPGCRLQSLLNPCYPEILDPNGPSLSQVIFSGSPSASPTLHPPQRLGIEGITTSRDSVVLLQ